MRDDDYEKVKSYKYYFWLDEMIMDLWSEYIDLIITESTIEECKNKLKVIEFYEKELNSLSENMSFEEANKWRRDNSIQTPMQRLCEKLYRSRQKRK